ncbi:MAG: hypothetical protein GTN78_02600, partial [Gemmatimonadales bacterium]|nr:hypothetical protein [Gemmatimonadales bacterium]
MRTLERDTGWVNSIAFSPNGGTLASGGLDAKIRLWRLASSSAGDVGGGRLLNTLEGHSDWVRVVAYSPDGRFLASGGLDTAVRLWLLPEGLGSPGDA